MDDSPGHARLARQLMDHSPGHARLARQLVDHSPGHALRARHSSISSVADTGTDSEGNTWNLEIDPKSSQPGYEGTNFVGVYDDGFSRAGYNGVKFTHPFVVRMPGKTNKSGCNSLAIEGRFETALEAAVAFARIKAGLPGKPEEPEKPTGTALVVHTDHTALLQRLVEYLEARGGSAALVAGWSTKVGVRINPQTGQACDIYYISAENVKFRSRIEVAQHFGLMEASVKAAPNPDFVSRRVVGECPPEAVDKKLWASAHKQGWSVFSTDDGHNRYTAPDGHKFHRKPDAEAWRPGGPPPKKQRLQLTNQSAAAPSPALLTLASSAVMASAALASKDHAAPPLPLTAVKPKQAAPVAPKVEATAPPKSQIHAPPAPPPKAPPGMEPVRAALARIGLERYAEALEELGYDDLGYLGILSEERLRQVAAEASMKAGHASKFAAWLITGPPAFS